MHGKLLFIVLSTLLVGCGRPSAESAARPDTRPLVVQPVADVPVTPAAAPPQKERQEFEYPADLGGRAVARAVAPDQPAVPPTDRLATQARAYAAPSTPVEYLARVSVRQTETLPVLPPGSANVKFAVPPETIPLDLGSGSQSVPAKPKLPVAAPVVVRSRDVNLPPPLPTLGRPARDRVSLDDPTSEIANSAITSPAVKVSVDPAAFLRVGLPNPFELGEHIRSNVAPAAEPSLDPVSVDPRRVK